jgi:biotin carboxylase
MLPSLLVANRGEIACRIIRTVRRLGLRTIASTVAACSPPITEMREFGQLHRNRPP